MDDKLLKQFLSRIAQIESSGGQNVDHKQAQHGIHAGTSAYGQYGLMPNTIQEIINRERLAGNMSPELQGLYKQDQNVVKEKLSQNPQIEQMLASRLLNRHSGNDVSAAFAWNQGSNLQPSEITPELIKQKDYTQKYTRLKNQDDAEDALAKTKVLNQMAQLGPYGEDL